MNPELKAKWVEALRSGKYAQTTGRLKEGDAFCCLGVLCDVYAPGSWSNFDDFRYEDFESSGSLPVVFGYDIGLSDKEQDTLIDMNDGNNDWRNDRQSFSQIADWIEANIEATDKTSNSGT